MDYRWPRKTFKRHGPIHFGKEFNVSDWDKHLQEPNLYRSIFKKLELRSTERKNLLSTAPVEPKFDLAWVLRHEDQVIGSILKAIKKGDLEFSGHQISQVFVGKLRDFYIASWPDRIVLMAMAHILGQAIQPLLSSKVYSFQSGIGAVDAQKALLNYIRLNKKVPLYCLNRDISKYGDSIPQDKLHSELERRTQFTANPLFQKLFEQAMRVRFFPKKYPEREAILFRGIPSGSPLVPVLENFYLGPLDEELEKIPNSFYARYGDDFIFSNLDHTVALQADEKIETCLKSLGLQIKVEKKKNYLMHSVNKEVKAFRPIESFDWLGRRITGHGVLGCKREHFEYARDQIRLHIEQFLVRHRKIDLEENFKWEVLGLSLNAILAPRQNSRLTSYLYSHENHHILKQYDRFVVFEVHRQLQLYLGLKKKEAWQKFRQLKFHSVSHTLNQRRQKARS